MGTVINVNERLNEFFDDLFEIVERVREDFGLECDDCSRHDGDVYYDHSVTMNFFSDEYRKNDSGDSMFKFRSTGDAVKRFREIIGRIPKPEFGVGDKIWAIVYGKIVCGKVEDMLLGYYKTDKGMIPFNGAFINKQALLSYLSDNADADE